MHSTDESGLRSRRFTMVGLAAGIPIAVLALHAYRYLPFIADDSLISLRYAARLLQGDGLTWTDGERVEGYSNLLWILCSALLGLLGMDLITAARVLGVAGMSSAILAVVHLHRPRDPGSALTVFGAGMGMALTGAFAVWAVGGLEQPLLIGLLAWASTTSLRLQEDVDSTLRRAVLPGVLLGLACWTRPDTPLFVSVIAFLLLAGGGFSSRSWKRAAVVAGIALAFWLAQLGFRLAYYGDWVANSTRAKLAFSKMRLMRGLEYLGSGLWPLAGLVVPALVAVGLSFRTPALRRRIAWFGLPAVVWCLYVALIGGDIFPGRRHLGVVVMLSAFLSAELYAFLRRPVVAAAVMAVALSILGWAQWKHDPEHQRAMHETWEWDGQVVGRLLQQAFGEREPLLAVTAAGCVPYFSGLPSLDLLGLNDRHMALHPPADLGQGALGHELGDGEYALSREPDLVIFCSPIGSLDPCFRSGREMVANPQFHQRYRLVMFLGTDPYPVRSLIWIRLDSPRVGLRISPERVAIPGYLLGGSGDAEACLDAEGQMGMRLNTDETVLEQQLNLGVGDWELRTRGTGRIRSVVRGSFGEARSAGGEDVARFRLRRTDSTSVSLSIQGTGHVRRVVFRQLP